MMDSISLMQKAMQLLSERKLFTTTLIMFSLDIYQYICKNTRCNTAPHWHRRKNTLDGVIYCPKCKQNWYLRTRSAIQGIF